MRDDLRDNRNRVSVPYVSWESRVDPFSALESAGIFRRHGAAVDKTVRTNARIESAEVGQTGVSFPTRELRSVIYTAVPSR